MTHSLSRKDNHRQSLLRNLVTSLILYEEIRTTATKARAVRPIVERLIFRAKESASGRSASGGNDLAARRRFLGYFFDKNATKKMFEVVVPRYRKIAAGFVKIYKIGPRVGDSAQMVILKLVPGQTEEVKAIIPGESKAKKDIKNAQKESKRVKETKDSAKTTSKKTG